MRKAHDFLYSKRMRILLLLIRLGLIVLLLPLAGCSARIVPPAQPDEPRVVFLLDHGRHSSLVLARADGTLVRYSYGDWRYYAEGETGLIHGARAVFVPSPAALGRRELPGPATAENVGRQVLVVIERILSLQAEASAVDGLQTRLEAIYLANHDRVLFRAEYDLEFVPHPRAYTLGYNSNRAVADWLIELGSEIHGTPILSRWRLLDSDQD